MFEQLISWSESNYSHLPWREKRSLYNTLVSEIMLQQTTVGTVLNHFDRFIQKYPDIQTLAKASEEQILMDWKGLGYYRRAKNLLKAAKDIVTKFHGEIPLELTELKSIHGIGDYTANALLAMGEDKRALAVDANLERVLARLYGLKLDKGPKLQKEIYRLFNARQIASELELVGARAYNEGLMDLGRSICKARAAHCELCPLANICEARKSNPLDYPFVKESTANQKIYELHLLRVIYKHEDQLLVYQKNKNEWLSSQYEVPTFVLYAEDPNLKQYPTIELEGHIYNLPSVKTSITKYRITNYILYGNEKDIPLKDKRYVYKKLDGLNLSTASTKALNF